MPPKFRERGAAAVEFALILPMLLMLIGGVIDFGNLYYNQLILSNAARDGVRLIASNSTASPAWTQAYIQQRITNSASPIVVSSAATSWTCTSGSSVTVTVTRSTAFKWTVLGMVPGLPTPTPTGKVQIACS
ncbi:TadE/TadG family type IV pilus assembly protein [Pedococcus bigeumensis]|nr:TadE/TadG family type IV pilus assembly protein [Pedococcus bigeumensis]